MTTKNRLKRLLPAALLLFSFHCLQAQVNIGSSQTPHNFSILELTSNSQGLRLAQLSTAQRNDWRDYFLGKTQTNPANPSSTGYISASDKQDARGLVIYNTDTGCLEYWNNTKWVSLCEGCDGKITKVEIIDSDTNDPSKTSIEMTTGGDLTLTANTTGGTATLYEWYMDDQKGAGSVLVATTTANTYKLPQSVTDNDGIYVYTVKAINACSNKIDTLEVKFESAT
ncbi:hypothetical protein FACS1894123_04070 [Bacteroidia bacterium]|nr:hypothetical protein FACS1894123_04070 [Bacteroidia bacterium]